MDKPTRFYSRRQEERVAGIIGGKVVANSGATTFNKGDVEGEDILLECKTLTKQQKTQSLEKAWFEKQREEAISRGKSLSGVVVDFGDLTEQFFVLDERTFRRLYGAWRESVAEAE